MRNYSLFIITEMVVLHAAEIFAMLRFRFDAQSEPTKMDAALRKRCYTDLTENFRYLFIVLLC